ncbi:hypothetical protein R5R35_006752 [Gryllus longicercus]
MLFLVIFSALLTIASSQSPNAAVSCTPKPPTQLSESLAGRIVYCTNSEQKKCLDQNKVLLEGKCYTLGTPGPCREYEIVVVDKKVYDESKIVRGKCHPLFTCNNNQFEERMSYDQCCYDTTEIDNKICPREMNLRLRKNAFGEGECELISNATNSYTTPKFLLRDGFCYFPNDVLNYEYTLSTYEHRFPQLRVEHALANMTFHCTPQERACFEKDLVLFPQRDGQCYPLLSTRPCPHGHWLVLDAGALELGVLTPVCAGPRCPPGHLFMARDQRCRSLTELQTELCAGEDLLFDVFGEAHCGRFVRQKDLLRMPRRKNGDTCALQRPNPFADGFAGGQSVLMPLCGPSDQERCRLPVMHTPEKPSL